MAELRAYLPLWNAASAKVAEAALRIYAVEHDETDTSTALIPKGTDGRALR
jgi:hypothetical protein